MSSDKNRFPGICRGATGCPNIIADRPSGCGLLALLLILCLAAEGEAGDYRVRRKTPNHVVDAAINRNPPVMGENTIRIEIRDAGGNTSPGRGCP